ncbi:nickel pincer cofactor biosynthesis protein LarC [Nocardioides sp.]|uniref:nickel pincer cofactor biosynthesis protein LarC n=1 Tax=Nocardioides sp. TaxID=35761 RepID=UPI003D111DF6
MTVWIDASSGASGDMLLGALVGVGVPVEVLQTAIDAVTPEPVRLAPATVQRNGFSAVLCGVAIEDSVHHRSWRDIRALLLGAELSEEVRLLAVRVFERLALAEATVHGSDPLDVSFHEVGSLDAIADIVGVCAGFDWLWSGRAGPREVVVSPVAVGSGSVRSAHGPLPVPPPAVAELLRGVPSYAGLPGAPAMELCTPTGAALLTELATSWGAQPAMTVTTIGVGAGTRDPQGYANVLRILVSTDSAPDPSAVPLLIESNVDDLDPRVWPSVIATLLSAGASDAWLTPILMKKGRPAHTLSVLVRSDRAPAVRSAIFRHTSTIGLRESPLAKHALDREMRTVHVQGQEIAIKLASEDGEIVNAQPEYEDVARAAAALGRPVSEVLADAIGASRRMISPE